MPMGMLRIKDLYDGEGAPMRVTLETFLAATEPHLLADLTPGERRMRTKRAAKFAAETGREVPPGGKPRLPVDAWAVAYPTYAD